MDKELKEIEKLLSEIKVRQKKLLDIGYNMKMNHVYNNAFYEISDLVDLFHNIDNKHLIDKQIKLILEALNKEG